MKQLVEQLSYKIISDIFSWITASIVPLPWVMLTYSATATSGYTSNSASTKRCRKKKSFTELKEEESSLLKERIVLEKEIATKNANFEVMRNTNESLKRMKLGFGSKSHNKPSSTSIELQGTVAGQPHQRIVASEVPTQDNTRSQPSESRPNKIESTGESFFMIPDLNMMPSDDGMI
ncbi:uncharacterized protein LOC123898391 isoform X2 [Trifolium pratense]|uniref:uncharacterized protein LOC123898391 isoform X2 n=1 Tax=Trifolium pratense TaxID=57577 RepID=UPI001E6906CE|nr:uncharacterized protein LOC123898391 isoform X2 [Trifolium pratense]